MSKPRVPKPLPVSGESKHTPELLWAAQWMLQFAEKFSREHNTGPTMIACLDRARAAIEKATK